MNYKNLKEILENATADEIMGLIKCISDEQERYLSQKEAENYLDVSRQLLHKLVKSGEISLTKIGSKNKYPKSSLDNYLKRNTIISQYDQ